jgi:PPOX class probable F420-dependent enzyme
MNVRSTIVPKQRVSLGPASPFARFTDRWAVRLTTYKRDGTPVGTAVNLAVAGDKAYFRTYEETWKFKRLARDPRVEVAPSTIRGKSTGPSMRARARLLDGTEDQRASALIEAKHPVFQGVLVRLVHRIAGYHTRHFELEASEVRMHPRAVVTPSS